MVAWTMVVTVTWKPVIVFGLYVGRVAHIIWGWIEEPKVTFRILVWTTVSVVESLAEKNRRMSVVNFRMEKHFQTTKCSPIANWHWRKNHYESYSFNWTLPTISVSLGVDSSLTESLDENELTSWSQSCKTLSERGSQLTHVCTPYPQNCEVTSLCGVTLLRNAEIVIICYTAGEN